MISLADSTVRECPEAWIDIVAPYITGTVLTLGLESPFADLIVGNLVTTSIPKPVSYPELYELTFSNYTQQQKKRTTHILENIFIIYLTMI